MSTQALSELMYDENTKKHKMLVISVGLSIVSLLTFHTHAADPEQFHIALAGSNGMRVR